MALKLTPAKLLKNTGAICKNCDLPKGKHVPVYAMNLEPGAVVSVTLVCSRNLFEPQKKTRPNVGPKYKKVIR